MPTQLRPLYDRVLVRPADPPKLSAGGLVLPSQFAEKSGRGEVLAAGPGRMTPEGVVIPMTVRPGDLVLYGPYAGDDIEAEGEMLKILREQDIFLIIYPE